MKRIRNPLFWRRVFFYVRDLTHHEVGTMKWDPNDPILRSPLAPHESRATLRMHRAGWPGNEIMKKLNLKGTQLMQSLREAMSDEGDAHRSGRPIHDGTVEKGTV